MNVFPPVVTNNSLEAISKKKIFVFIRLWRSGPNDFFEMVSEQVLNKEQQAERHNDHAGDQAVYGQVMLAVFLG